MYFVDLDIETEKAFVMQLCNRYNYEKLYC